MSDLKKYYYVKVSEDIPISDRTPSAGPNPHIGGMRRFWGKNAIIVKRGAYAYNVTDDGRALAWLRAHRQ